MVKWSRTIGAIAMGITSAVVLSPAAQASPLQVVYPPQEHETVADRIFFIGTADPDAPVLLNGQPIEERSPAGHFAPSIPLDLGDNEITLTQGETSLTFRVTRVSLEPVLPEGLGFVEGSLTPAADVTYPPGEWVCFRAIAPAQSRVQVNLATSLVELTPRQNVVALPPNSAALTADNDPLPLQATTYEGCMAPDGTGNLGQPTYTLTRGGQSVGAMAPGSVSVVPVPPFAVAEVTAEAGVARTGPSTDYSRLTPLPRGTRAAVTAREGDWLRLDYGGWIRASETRISQSAAPPRSRIRSVRSRQIPGWTEVRFPLEVPVPVSIAQTADTLTLTLYNTVPQTDTIYPEQDPVIARLDWQPILPDQAQYTLHFKPRQQWGYTVRYEGTTLVLALRHPPQVSRDRPLAGTTILIDPGHGSENDLGALGPTGYPEKDVNLVVSKLLRAALEARGARVVMTREGDDDLFPGDRVEIINQVQPTLAISVHYNALPDSGDALNTAGIGTFWYNTQAHSLAQWIHDDLTQRLGRPSYGVFWNNLALTRPTIAPSVLLELGFMINPYEFEWIVDPDAQRDLADALAASIEAWMRQATQP